MSSTHHVMISYSRQEITFVDSLARALEKRGLTTWVDFRNLVPGHPWDDQIGEGIKNAETILLVVSEASMTSEAVTVEWERALASGKRIVLAIFESQPLDEQLAGLEWVDFRQRFGKAMSQLEQILSSEPQTPSRPAPQTGFRIPPAPRIFRLLGFIEAFASLLTLPFIIFALRLMPLPGRVKKRTFQMRRIWPLLLGLPVAHFLAGIFIGTNVVQGTLTWESGIIAIVLTLYYYLALPITWIVGPVMAGMLLFLPGMYRWAGPGGAWVRSRARLPDPMPPFQPVRVILEHAAQDAPFAAEIRKALEKAGHMIAENSEGADIILVLLSRFKTASEFDPERAPLVPVLIQTCDVNARLSQIQWVDMRQGIRRYKHLAALLSEPRLLLQALGTVPTRSARPALPTGVARLAGFFWGVVIWKLVGTVATWVLLFEVVVMSGFSGVEASTIFYTLSFVVSSAVGVTAAYAATRSLENRGGLLRSPPGLAAALALVSLLAFPGFAFTFIIGQLQSIETATLIGPESITSCIFPMLLCAVVTPTGMVLNANKEVRMWLAHTRDASPGGGSG